MNAADESSIPTTVNLLTSSLIFPSSPLPRWYEMRCWMPLLKAQVKYRAEKVGYSGKKGENADDLGAAKMNYEYVKQPPDDDKQH